jgi:hypothetical protein
MAINDPAISDQDRASLHRAYQALLDNRKAMIDGMSGVEQSPYFRGVIVDSIISGLMAHFHEFARNKSAHTDEINGWGRTFEAYVSNRVTQIGAILTQLKPPAAPPKK